MTTQEQADEIANSLCQWDDEEVRGAWIRFNQLQKRCGHRWSPRAWGCALATLHQYGLIEWRDKPRVGRFKASTRRQVA